MSFYVVVFVQLTTGDLWGTNSDRYVQWNLCDNLLKFFYIFSFLKIIFGVISLLR